MKLQNAPNRISLITLYCLSLILTVACLAQSPGEESPAGKTFERRIYFKLPLAQPEFHWYFEDEEEFLRGELKLTIRSNGTITEHLVFKEGKISEEWVTKKSEKGFYFLFKSRSAYEISREDEVTIHLSVAKDLKGIGADFNGTLKADTYQSKGHFTIYELEDDDESSFAFLSKKNWDPHWELELTSTQGWMEKQYEEKKAPLRSGRENYLISFNHNDDGTRSVAVVDHSLKEFYFESFGNHEDFMLYVIENRKQLPMHIQCIGTVGSESFVDFCEKLQAKLAPIHISYFDGSKLIGPQTADDIATAPNYYQTYKRRKKAVPPE